MCELASKKTVDRLFLLKVHGHVYYALFIESRSWETSFSAMKKSFFLGGHEQVRVYAHTWLLYYRNVLYQLLIGLVLGFSWRGCKIDVLACFRNIWKLSVKLSSRSPHFQASFHLFFAFTDPKLRSRLPVSGSQMWNDRSIVSFYLLHLADLSPFESLKSLR